MSCCAGSLLCLGVCGRTCGSCMASSVLTRGRGSLSTAREYTSYAAAGCSGSVNRRGNPWPEGMPSLAAIRRGGRRRDTPSGPHRLMGGSRRARRRLGGLCRFGETRGAAVRFCLVSCAHFGWWSRIRPVNQRGQTTGRVPEMIPAAIRVLPSLGRSTRPAMRGSLSRGTQSATSALPPSPSQENDIAMSAQTHQSPGCTWLICS